MNAKLLLLSLPLLWVQPTLALPPPEDIPEEILRTEIITEARSPLDGKPLTVAQYVELQEQLQVESNPEALLPPRIKQLILLLRVRKTIRTLVPF